MRTTKKEQKPFFTRHTKSIIGVLGATVIFIILAIYVSVLREEVAAIKKDGGYYIVSDDTGSCNLPGVEFKKYE